MRYLKNTSLYCNNKNQSYTQAKPGYVVLGVLFLSQMLLCSQTASALTALTDEELLKQTGQSLFTVNSIAPNELGNPNKDIGFYRLGLSAEVEINANIDNLQLGCGGDNGAGACDIEMSQVRLTGTQPVNGSYVNSDAKLTNPFLEVAIKNPGGLANRELIGIRLGAAETLALLSSGTNPNTKTLNDDTGISRLSGDTTLYVSNTKLTNICITTLGLCTIRATADIKEPYVTPLYFKRDTTFDLLKLQADAKATALRIPIQLNNINVYKEPLKTVHNIYIAQYDRNGANSIPTKDFYLSLQKQPIIWQKLSTGNFNGVAAQRGWWLSIPQIQVKDMTIDELVNIPTLSAVGGIFGSAVNLQPVDLALTPTKNCYGNLQFC